MKLDLKWVGEGLNFQCQGSGKCCVSHGEYGYVYLDKFDRKRLAKHLGLTLKNFETEFCEISEGYFRLKPKARSQKCIFLEGKKCGLYEARPTQCRTWPFWPEVMNAKDWQKDVANFCPGVGKGPLVTAKEIEKQVLIQMASEAEMEIE